jgi:VanZ family protein
MKHINAIWIWLPAVLAFVIIFILSSANGEQSSGFTMTIMIKIIESLEKLTSGSINLSMFSLWELDHFIRKIGHMIEYALLAIAVILPLYYYRFRRWKLILLCFGICFIYACADEIHQLFIYEREGRFLDIFIDCIGVFTGILLFHIFKTIVQSIRGLIPRN